MYVVRDDYVSFYETKSCGHVLCRPTYLNPGRFSKGQFSSPPIFLTFASVQYLKQQVKYLHYSFAETIISNLGVVKVFEVVRREALLVSSHGHWKRLAQRTSENRFSTDIP